MRIVEEIFMNEIATFLVQVIFSVILFLEINLKHEKEGYFNNLFTYRNI